ncbi:unnamed protein product [Owenia fusiformis]|uniref:Peptidase M24 domain-containing protein n=1 Tax=Owenia fusiformis TaxID=6347 RepID=A0A8J1Y0J1_OWEFU|nr:unnamed protein product [Owenia fusiformis]
MADHDSDDEVQTIAEDIVVTKYKMAAKLVNEILEQVSAKCVEGAKVLELCEFGDKLLTDGTANVFKKEKEMKKGIAFPTCISVNNLICHFSPLRSEPDVVLKNGDVVKIDLGAHIDGFAAVVAHTLAVGSSKDKIIEGRLADVMLAAHYASEVAIRMVKPGNENYMVTEAIQKVAEAFKCKPIEGMLSHQLSKQIIDGEKAIILNPSEAHRKEHAKCEFDVHEVYALDMLISTGEGKGRERDAKPTVYKKSDSTYSLKMKASRQFFSEMDKKFSTMPFTIRSFEEEKKAKMGVVECLKHDLVEAFPVLYERDGETVVQMKFTVLLMPNGPMKITGPTFNPDLYKSEYKIEDEEINKLLATSVSRKANKKKKKKAVEQTQAATTESEDPPQLVEKPEA